MGDEIRPDNEGSWLQGRINTANVRSSQHVWRLIDSTYTPIDWHLDFKSGYRWPENTWYRHIKYGHRPGADVKVPWELSRMQHLPMLAWAYGLSRSHAEAFKPAETYSREFRNEILDFIATNPPRFGVNWKCTMDVGIRLAGWVVAFDLFSALGAVFDKEFMRIFVRSVYEHGKHCIDNLEYSRKLRSNHYLCDIAGILFAAAYLPATDETILWLDFAMQELVNEMELQFNPDGSNFEASTNYHRLSTEVMIYCALLCLSLPEAKKARLKGCGHTRFKAGPSLQPYGSQKYDLDDPCIFPKQYWERIERAIEFTMHLSKPNGEVPQIGDNDSGRFLKLWPAYSLTTAEEAKHVTRIWKTMRGWTMTRRIRTKTYWIIATCWEWGRCFSSALISSPARVKIHRKCLWYAASCVTGPCLHTTVMNPMKIPQPGEKQMLVEDPEGMDSGVGRQE